MPKIFEPTLSYYFVRTGNKLNNTVILRSVATKDLRFFAATSFRLRMTFQSFCWAHVPGNKVVLSGCLKSSMTLGSGCHPGLYPSASSPYIGILSL